MHDGTRLYLWKNGRELASISDGTTTWTYTYDANGMRTSRSDANGVTYYYYYDGGTLTRMEVSNYMLWFDPVADTVWMNLTLYYYVRNQQGDVIAITDIYGDPVVYYTYDAWGNVLSITGSKASTLGRINPIRYRGYVYDNETGMYYLQSRYYNPETGRFINADAFASTGQGFVGNNMFAYCNNNPVNNSDYTGYYTDGQIHDFVIQHIVAWAAENGKTFRYLRTDTFIWYDNVWRGSFFGFCDLYDAQTGEMWELKKNSASRSCRTEYAEAQLNNYITNGVLIADPDLPRKHPTTWIPSGIFTKYDHWGNRYEISYWDQGGGILRYQYYIVPSQATVMVVAGALLAGVLISQNNQQKTQMNMR